MNTLKGERLDSIDILRAFAIIFMILCHFPIFLSSGTGPNNFLYFFSNHLIGDFAAPLFLVLVGISQALAATKKSRELLFLRGVVIFLFGMILSVILHHKANLFDWDILPLIGFSIVTLVFCSRQSNSALLIIAFLIIIISPYFRQHSDYLHFWGDQIESPQFLSKLGIYKKILFDPVADYSPEFLARSIFKGFFFNGYFPIFPWLSFPLVGYVIGRKIIRREIEKLLSTFSLQAVGFLLLGFGVAFISVYLNQSNPIANNLSSFSFYPDSFSLILVQFGVVLALFSTVNLYFKNNKANLEISRQNILVDYLRLISRYSLSIYVIHQLIIFWGIKIADSINGNRISYYENCFSTPAAFGLGLLFLFLLYPALRMWRKFNGKYCFEWFLQKITECQARTFENFYNIIK